MASPEEVAPAAFSYSSTDGAKCQHGAATMTAKTKTSVTKRKRTKRGLRSFISSPPQPAPAPHEEVEEEYFSTSTTTTTIEEEEEDMAHCLILLAQGRTAASSFSFPTAEDPGLQSTGGTTIKRFGGTTTACSTAGDTLHAVYECKTCNKRFPSFQALGGHRASHKKPKQLLLLLQPVPAVKVDVVDMDLDDVGLDITMNSSSFARIKPALTTAPPAAAPVPANKLSSRVHECSICGSEFASGQALGGHMRRHRPVLGAPESLREAPNSSSSGGGGSKKEEKKCMLLSLDLNLPAPSEENAPNSMAGTFTFVDHRPLALVDCHY